MLRSVTAALWLSEGGKAQEGDVEWIQETGDGNCSLSDCRPSFPARNANCNNLAVSLFITNLKLCVGLMP